MRVKVTSEERRLPGDLESRIQAVRGDLSFSGCNTRDVTPPAFILKKKKMADFPSPHLCAWPQNEKLIQILVRKLK